MLGNWNPFEAGERLLGKVIDAKGSAGRVLTAGENDPAYGVDEYGRRYLRGTPSAPAAGIDGRLVLIVAGVAAIGLVIILAKK